MRAAERRAAEMPASWLGWVGSDRNLIGEGLDEISYVRLVWGKAVAFRRIERPTEEPLSPRSPVGVSLGTFRLLFSDLSLSD